MKVLHILMYKKDVLKSYKLISTIFILHTNMAQKVKTNYKQIHFLHARTN